MTKLHLNLGENGYDVIVGKGLLQNAQDYLNLNRKVLVVTDSGVPEEYSNLICGKCATFKKITVEQGEGAKSFETLQKVLEAMCEFNMDRKDCAVAVGGGVVGDLVGFASSIYMRGIDFYNVPTTVLSQVDSSIGGKTAINFNGVKNIVGAFHQPKCVLVDIDTLKTLSDRQISNGLAEAVKMSLTSDAQLFERLENLTYAQIVENLEEIIVNSLKIKQFVVEKDEKESGLRRILNFGHTLGHGIEAETDMKGTYHGECVSLGMIPVCSLDVRKRLKSVLNKLNLPTQLPCDLEKALKYVAHDKKRDGNSVNVVLVNEIGKFDMQKITFEKFAEIVKSAF